MLYIDSEYLQYLVLVSAYLLTYQGRPIHCPSSIAPIYPVLTTWDLCTSIKIVLSSRVLKYASDFFFPLRACLIQSYALVYSRPRSLNESLPTAVIHSFTRRVS